MIPRLCNVKCMQIEKVFERYLNEINKKRSRFFLKTWTVDIDGLKNIAFK